MGGLKGPGWSETEEEREKMLSLPLKRPGMQEEKLGTLQSFPPNVLPTLGGSRLTPRFLGSHTTGTQLLPRARAALPAWWDAAIAPRLLLTLEGLLLV